MRANLILLMAAATLAACGSSTAPDEANDNGLTSPAVAIPDAPGAPAPSSSGGGGAGQTGTGFGGPADGTEPPCLQAVRLASDILPGPVSCRR